jgi:hypothetical protein
LFVAALGAAGAQAANTQLTIRITEITTESFFISDPPAGLNQD